MSSMKRKDFSINLNVEGSGYSMAQFYHYSQIICEMAGSKGLMASLGANLGAFVQHFCEANRDLPIWIGNNAF